MTAEADSATRLSPAEEAAIDNAMGQLSDLVNIAAGCLDGATPLEQIDMTREALRGAGNAMTSYRRRAKRDDRKRFRSGETTP